VTFLLSASARARRVSQVAASVVAVTTVVCPRMAARRSPPPPCWPFLPFLFGAAGPTRLAAVPGGTCGTGGTGGPAGTCDVHGTTSVVVWPGAHGSPPAPGIGGGPGGTGGPAGTRDVHGTTSVVVWPGAHGSPPAPGIGGGGGGPLPPWSPGGGSPPPPSPPGGGVVGAGSVVGAGGVVGSTSPAAFAACCCCCCCVRWASAAGWGQTSTACAFLSRPVSSSFLSLTPLMASSSNFFRSTVPSSADMPSNVGQQPFASKGTKKYLGGFTRPSPRPTPNANDPTLQILFAGEKPPARANAVRRRENHGPRNACVSHAVCWPVRARCAFALGVLVLVMNPVALGTQSAALPNPDRHVDPERLDAARPLRDSRGRVLD
jgi:hypothetical protein